MKQEDDQLYIFFKNKNKKFQKHIKINLELKQITVFQKITGKTQLLFFVLNEALFSKEK